MERCCVEGCGRPAEFEVILYDVYTPLEEVFFQRDFTCPFLCGLHMAQNEEGCRGVREPLTCARYPYSNRNEAPGITIYRPLNDAGEGHGPIYYVPAGGNGRYRRWRKS